MASARADDARDFGRQMDQILDAIRVAYSAVNSKAPGKIDLSDCIQTVSTCMTNIFTTAKYARKVSPQLGGQYAGAVEDSLHDYRCAALADVFEHVDTFVRFLRDLSDKDLTLANIRPSTAINVEKYTASLAEFNTVLGLLEATRGKPAAGSLESFMTRSTWVNDPVKKNYIDRMIELGRSAAAHFGLVSDETISLCESIHAWMQLMLCVTGYKDAPVFTTNPVNDIVRHMTKAVSTGTGHAALRTLYLGMITYNLPVSLMNIRSDLEMCRLIAETNDFLPKLMELLTPDMRLFLMPTKKNERYMSMCMVVDFITRADATSGMCAAHVCTPIGMFTPKGIVADDPAVHVQGLVEADQRIYDIFGKSKAYQLPAPVIWGPVKDSGLTYMVYDHIAMHTPNRVQLVTAFQVAHLRSDSLEFTTTHACPLLRYNGFLFNIDNVVREDICRLVVTEDVSPSEYIPCDDTHRVSGVEFSVRRLIGVVPSAMAHTKHAFANLLCDGNLLALDTCVGFKCMQMAACLLCDQCAVAVPFIASRQPICDYCRDCFIERKDAIVAGQKFSFPPQRTIVGHRALPKRLSREQIQYCGMDRVLAENEMRMPVYFLDTGRLFAVSSCDGRVWSMKVEGCRALRTKSQVAPVVCLRLYPILHNATGECFEILALPLVISRHGTGNSLLSYSDTRGLDGPIIVWPDQAAFVDFFPMAYAQTTGMHPRAILLRSARLGPAALTKTDVTEINDLAASIGSACTQDTDRFVYNPAVPHAVVGDASVFPVQCASCNVFRFIDQFVSADTNTGLVCRACATTTPARVTCVKGECWMCKRSYVWTGHDHRDSLCDHCIYRANPSISRAAPPPQKKE